MSDRAYLFLCIGLCAAILVCIGAIVWMLCDLSSMEAPGYIGAQFVSGGIAYARL